VTKQGALVGCLMMSLVVRAVAGTPAPAPIRDADTREWWKITADLSGDEMEGRDTGSPGHARAAAFVAARFKAAGLKPAGDAGAYTQTLRLHEVRVESQGTEFAVVRSAGGEARLRFLHEISVRPSETMSSTLDAPLSFRGYCSTSEMGADLHGKIAVCFGGRRHGLPSASERLAAASAAGAAGLVAVDDPGFTIEPARWPDAYARAVTLADAPPAPSGAAIPVMRISTAAFAELIQGSGHAGEEILAAGAASRPLPGFEVPARLRAAFRVSRRDYTSDNVLALLPGTDPEVGKEIVVVSAHLDGYGRGEPVDGDDLYNGTLDDAAYVATLIRLAEQRRGRGFHRSLLFAAFTGEEKGLLGATGFTQHPTVSRADLVADINLDQLRPLFPLRILTMHAVDDTTLGAAARLVAADMHIEIRRDLEPERNLNQRADHWPFLQMGIPATGFVFGYDAGSEDERRYREWYQVRYHRPQDDLTQPMDFKAAADFNRFFYRFAQAVSDAAERPAFTRGTTPPKSAGRPN
jgi:Zn-dependent M28 family amino/carboxypeptidase